MLDWIGEYLEHSRNTPSCRRRGRAMCERRCLVTARRRESLETIFSDFESKIVPESHWNHPAFFGYFATSSSVPGFSPSC
jgi:aromatic-L-amino-acid decarboxylase